MTSQVKHGAKLLGRVGRLASNARLGATETANAGAAAATHASPPPALKPSFAGRAQAFTRVGANLLPPLAHSAAQASAHQQTANLPHHQLISHMATSAATAAATAKPTYMGQEEKKEYLSSLPPQALGNLAFNDTQIKLHARGKDVPEARRPELQAINQRLASAQAALEQHEPGTKVGFEPHPERASLGLRPTITRPDGTKVAIDLREALEARAHHPDATFSHTINHGRAMSLVSRMQIDNNPNNLCGAGAYFHNHETTAFNHAFSVHPVGHIMNAKLTSDCAPHIRTNAGGAYIAVGGDGGKLQSADFAFPKEGKFIHGRRDDTDPSKVHYSVGKIGGDGHPDHSSLTPIDSLSHPSVSWLPKYE